MTASFAGSVGFIALLCAMAIGCGSDSTEPLLSEEGTFALERYGDDEIPILIRLEGQERTFIWADTLVISAGRWVQRIVIRDSLGPNAYSEFSGIETILYRVVRDTLFLLSFGPSVVDTAFVMRTGIRIPYDDPGRSSCLRAPCEAFYRRLR